MKHNDGRIPAEPNPGDGPDTDADIEALLSVAAYVDGASDSTGGLVAEIRAVRAAADAGATDMGVRQLAGAARAAGRESLQAANATFELFGDSLGWRVAAAIGLIVPLAWAYRMGSRVALELPLFF